MVEAKDLNKLIELYNKQVEYTDDYEATSSSGDYIGNEKEKNIYRNEKVKKEVEDEYWQKFNIEKYRNNSYDPYQQPVEENLNTEVVLDFIIDNNNDNNENDNSFDSEEKESEIGDKSNNNKKKRSWFKNFFFWK